MKNSLIKWLWILVITGVVFVFALFVLVSFTKMPDTEELENPKLEQATRIYSEQLEEFGKWFRFNRESVNFDELNPHLVDALICTEDIRFNSHTGIDPKSTLRAFVFLGKKGGASTITQQLAKLFYTPKPGNSFKRLWQKMKEWVIATEFEKRYTKEEILAMYLNKFDFLYDSSGIEAASNTYYGKKQNKLSIPQSAMLVGMLKNPYQYNPKKFPERAKARRNVVLSQMMKNGRISKADFDEMKNEPVDVSAFERESHTKGNAPYFRSELSKYVNQILSNEGAKKPDGSTYNIYRDGLKVYTTIDLDMQRHAETAMRKHMSQLQRTYFTVWDGLDPWTYDANDEQRKIRKDRLNRSIRETDRYQRLRTKYLGDVITQIKESVNDARMSDPDIIRMLEENKTKGHLTKLSRSKTISKKQVNEYKAIMTGEHFGTLKSQWSKLTKATRNEFNKKTKMKIFAYNDAGYRDANMSPLDSIKYHQKHLQFGSISMEPGTGYVRTWVGGIDKKYFKFDHITSNRQVGSTFKPFLYTTAIAAGTSPCQQYNDVQYTIPAKDPKFGLTKAWAPANSSEEFTKLPVTLKEGLKRSLNSISVKLMIELGTTEPVRDLVDLMGIEKKKIPPYPSICLGTPELNVLEMTAAYSAFANTGEYVKPIFIKRIEDKDGKTIYNAVPDKSRAINQRDNYAMIEMLKHAASFVHPHLKSEFGGKTGTTNDYVDGWFMGITPTLVTGTWVGGELPWIRFLRIQEGQGGVMARPYFLEFMKLVEADKNISYDLNARFELPAGDKIVTECGLYDIMKKKDQEALKKKKEAEDQFDDEFEEEEFDEEEFGEGE